MPKRVFISWSGDHSERVAKALCDWIPMVLHNASPWMSGDIPAGSRWNDELRKELAQSSFGVICATRDNIHRPWILFEAGALGKTLENAAVIPYLLNLEKEQLNDPLAQFQAASADRNGTFALVEAINKSLGDEGLPRDRLYRSFEKWWGDLEQRLENIRTTAYEKTKSELDVIKTYPDRTKRIVEDLRQLASLGDSELADQSVNFSGVLSAFALSDDEDKALLSERDLLLGLARRGCVIHSTITPPGKFDLNPDDIDKTIRRLEHLIKFLKKEDDLAHKSIQWAVSPFRQHNMYIIGMISCFEGFKQGTGAGYDLTLRQSRPDAVQLYKDLYLTVFDNSKVLTLEGYKDNKREGWKKSLQRCTLRRVEEALNTCKRIRATPQRKAKVGEQ